MPTNTNDLLVCNNLVSLSGAYFNKKMEVRYGSKCVGVHRCKQVEHLAQICGV